MSLLDFSKRRIVIDIIRRTRIAAELSDGDDGVVVGAPSATGGGGGGRPKYCTMIVDDSTLRIISSCVKVYDILEEGVTVIESIQRKRQPLRQLDAIYFLSPDPESIRLLCQDFINEKSPQYRSVYLYLSLPIPKDSPILETIAKCPGLLCRLQSFVEFNMSFIAYESRVFHFDTPSMLIPRLFPVTAASLNANRDLLNGVADNLTSVCLTLGLKPDIRFHANNFKLTEQLALAVHDKLSKASAITNLARGNSLLLIVDRSIEVAPLFLHEYTYQAYIYDLLDVSVCSPPRKAQTNTPPVPSGGKRLEEVTGSGAVADDLVEYRVEAGDGSVEYRKAVLGEHDDVYLRYRHQHLVVALKGVSEEIKKFLKENAAAKMNKKQPGEMMTTEEMQKTIRDLPQYQEMLAKYTIHQWVTQLCYAELTKRGLIKVGHLEQDLATGVDKDGKEASPQKVLKALGTLLSTPTVGTEEKLRLFLLYFTMMDGVQEDDRRRMMIAAQLSHVNSLCIQNFLRLGLDQGDSPPTGGNDGHKHHTHKLAKDKERIQFFSKRAKNGDIQLSRFQPCLKEVMERALQGGLHGGKFRYVSEPDMYSRGGFRDVEPRTGAATFVRARNQDWDFGNEGASGGPASATQRNGFADIGGSTVPVINPMAAGPAGEGASKVLIVFVLGGVCMSEMRSAYEVSKQLGADVYIGGDTILTPQRVLECMRDLNSSQQTSQAPYWAASTMVQAQR